MNTYRIATIGLTPDDRTHGLALANHPRFELAAYDDERLDAVVVASPPASHAADVLAAIGRGLHVLVSVPFALDVESARRMTEAAEAAGLACGVAYEYRFVPQAQATKELIVNGHVGALRSIEIARQNGALRASARCERGAWFDREHGGVAAWGLAHSIDLALWFAGRPPQRATGFVRTANPVRRDRDGEFAATADDGAFALLDFGGGPIARLSEDRTAPVESYLCAVYGEDRVAVSSGREIDATTLYTVDDDETNELQCAPSPYAKRGEISLLMELYDELVKRIEGLPNALPSFADALEVQRVVSAIGG